jgi:hypothetical protein
MDPWERSDLGAVGEGVCPVDKEDPLTQLRLIRFAHKSTQPSPDGRGAGTFDPAFYSTASFSRPCP